MNKHSKTYRSLVATALLTSSLFQFVAPVLADGTAAGTLINNTGTATYEDPNNPGTTINATSNTVTVTVAKVAGITVTGSGVTDDTNKGGQVKVNDKLYYTYTVTNVGNNPGKFRIPNLATVTGPGTAGTVQISYDGGTTWTDIPSSPGGSSSEVITKELPAAGSVLVRVPVTVAAGANSGDTISVKLGQTPGDAQNQPRTPDGGDVYTVDSADGTLPQEASGTSVNGTREASATQKINVGSTAKDLALATILKTRTGFDSSGSTDKLNNDVLTYGLSLRVEQSDVTNTGLTPAPLVGTNITVDSSQVPRILVSDAIPALTALKGTPTAPTGWKVVYTTDLVATDAKDAKWFTTLPSGTITRVGFINDPTVVTSVAPGQIVTGFTIQVVTSNVPSTGTTNIANIAQVFGQTAGDSNNTLVYDDSGDQNPANFDPTAKTFPSDPTKDTGYASSTPTNTDQANNNTGTNSPSGDYNVYTISPPQASSVLNGPNGAPDATGATSNNDDFTNKSALIPPNTAPGSKVNPPSVAFTNTVKNTGINPASISLLPTAPTTLGDLPTNSTVTLTYGSLSATYTYTYDGTTGKFNLTSETGSVGGNPISGTNPIRIDNLAAGATANYGVEVKLPANTPLSTDTGKGFPTPITAFIDNTTPTGDPNSKPLNITIDQVYTGFLKMLKESRVLQGTGPAPQTADTNFGTTAKTPAPGNILEYRITYTNISTPQAGTGDIIRTYATVTSNGAATPRRAPNN